MALVHGCIMIFTPGTNASDNLSLTNDDAASFHSANVKVWALCLLLPIPILAILGNPLIIVAVVRVRRLRTSANAFVVSLAVVDFLVAVLVLPFSLVRSVNGWHFGRCFCRAHFLLDVTFCTSSIVHLSCIALDRYIAVCDPLHYPARMSPRRVAVLLLLLCWSLPVVVSALCVSFGMKTQSSLAAVGGGQSCVAVFHAPYAFVTSTISFLPMGFVLFAYGKILKAARRQARCVHALDDQTGEMNRSATRRVLVHMERLRKERKAVKTLGLIMGVFLFCWLPFFCVNVVYPLKGLAISPLVLDASMWLGYANSSLNPILYTFFNKNNRHVFAWIHPSLVDKHIPSLPWKPSQDDI